MKFPTTVRYGARALVELAAAYPDRAVSVREVGQEQNLSAKYLERILQALKAAGLVQVVRGSRGGYVLARPPRSLTLKHVYERLVGSLAPVNCVDCPDSCSMQDTCPTWDTWVEVKGHWESSIRPMWSSWRCSRRQASAPRQLLRRNAPGR